MNDCRLTEGLYLYPTPGGAFHAVSSTEDDKSRRFLGALLNRGETPLSNIENLQTLMKFDNEQSCLELLHHCQKLGWIQGLESPIANPEGTLEDILPETLNNLSETGKVLLADAQGFYLASKGFPHEVAEELSALSAEISTVQNRRSGLLMNNLGMASDSWAIVDAVGNSRVGFWPIYIGLNRFVLVISGIPHFNQPDFVSLVWALSIRYSKPNS